MGRPAKKPEDRKDYHLRVPLNEVQRALIDQAVSLSHEDKAEWARVILLEAAMAQIAEAETARKRKK
jgi:hypothetical protein